MFIGNQPAAKKEAAAAAAHGDGTAGKEDASATADPVKQCVS